MPALISARFLVRCSLVSVESIWQAAIPWFWSFWTWSLMSERSGEMMMVVPRWLRRNEGSWKVRDLPEPVGRVARVLFPFRMWLIISSW